MQNFRFFMSGVGLDFVRWSEVRPSFVEASDGD
jgi:hypothetical protein